MEVGYEKDIGGLVKLSQKKFDNLSETSKQLNKYNSHISTDLSYIQAYVNPKITGLPFVLKELPVLYSHPLSKGKSHTWIGRVKLID